MEKFMQITLDSAEERQMRCYVFKENKNNKENIVIWVKDFDKKKAQYEEGS